MFSGAQDITRYGIYDRCVNVCEQTLLWFPLKPATLGNLFGTTFLWFIQTFVSCDKYFVYFLFLVYISNRLHDVLNIRFWRWLINMKWSIYYQSLRLQRAITALISLSCTSRPACPGECHSSKRKKPEVCCSWICDLCVITVSSRMICKFYW